MFLQPSRQPYKIIGDDWWDEPSSQADTGTPFKGVCFFVLPCRLIIIICLFPVWLAIKSKEPLRKIYCQIWLQQ